jgi:proteasome accessory factor C
VAERADDRLVRLLGLVAYLDGAGPVALDELAQRFGVTPRQIREDVDALWVSGTPGYMPDDLIDFDAFSLDEGVVHLTRARGMTRPLRLGTREAVALVAALRAMHAAPPVQADPERAAVVGSALDKLTAATGEAASAVDVRLASGGDPAVLAALTAALTARAAGQFEGMARQLSSGRQSWTTRINPSGQSSTRWMHAPWTHALQRFSSPS